MGTLNNQFTKEDVVKSLRCCFNQDVGCYEGDCPLQGIPNCVRKKIDLAIEFLEKSPDEPNNPLNLNELIKLMKEKRPVFIMGYGWYFIEKIISDKQTTKIYTHNNNNFVYSENSEMFYRNEVL